MIINALDFNTFNKDLMAAVYGSFDCYNENSKGLLALWTLKNP